MNVVHAWYALLGNSRTFITYKHLFDGFERLDDVLSLRVTDLIFMGVSQCTAPILYNRIQALRASTTGSIEKEEEEEEEDTTTNVRSTNNDATTGVAAIGIDNGTTKVSPV